MSTVFNGNGTIPSPTTGAQVRVAITGATNASPIVVTATAHGFKTGDTVEQEGVGGNTAANGVFQITRVDANTYNLNSTTGNGAYTSGGYAIDYEIQPAYTLPAPGEAASMVTMGPIVEGLSNLAPWHYRRAGKWRLYNQYQLFAGSSTTPYQSNPWSTNAGLGSSFSVLSNAQFSLASLSDTAGIPPFAASSGELWQFSITGTAVVLTDNTANNYAYMSIGAGIDVGTGVPASVAYGPYVDVWSFTNSNTNQMNVTTPFTLSTTIFAPAYNSSNLYLSLVGRVDAKFSGTPGLNLIGSLTGFINQYRKN